MSIFEKLKENRQKAAEQMANEKYQVMEMNGILWLTFNGSPIIPENYLKDDIREVVQELRKSYILREKR